TRGLTWPRMSEWPIGGRHTKMGMTRNAHQRRQPHGCARTDGSADTDSSALANQWTATARNTTLSGYQMAVDAANGSMPVRSACAGGSARGVIRIANKGG